MLLLYIHVIIHHATVRYIMLICDIPRNDTRNHLCNSRTILCSSEDSMPWAGQEQARERASSQRKTLPWVPASSSSPKCLTLSSRSSSIQSLGRFSPQKPSVPVKHCKSKKTTRSLVRNHVQANLLNKLSNPTFCYHKVPFTTWAPAKGRVKIRFHPPSPFSKGHNSL